MKAANPFVEHAVVGDVIGFTPSLNLEVKWEGGEVAELGNVLTPTQMKNQPSVKWEADPNSFYTLLMTDPDAPSRAQPEFREWHHWLVVNIPGNNISEGDVRSQYIGAGPPEKTGLHRYVFLVMKQKSKMSFSDVPDLKCTSTKLRACFNTKMFIQKYTLKLEAGNFVQAEWDEYVPTLYKQFTD